MLCSPAAAEMFTCLADHSARALGHGADPVQAEASMFPGMNSGYMTYLVSTTSSLPDFPRSGVSVRRRFRDFVVRLPVTS